MVTTVTKTISLSGSPDYSTLQSWEDAAPANLVTSDQLWQGTISLPGDVFTGSTVLLTIAGSTTDATRYKELTTATGASFRDNASAQTNALAYSESNGCAIRSSVTSNTVASTENFARISNVQIRGTSAAYTGQPLSMSGTTSKLTNCIVDFNGASTSAWPASLSNIAATNCLFVQNKSGTSKIARLAGSAVLLNCTLVAPTGLAAKPTVAITVAYTANTLTNCALFGATALKDGAGTPTYTTCVNEVATPPSGVTQVTYDNSAVVNTASNWKPLTGSGLLDIGTTNSAASPDIVGTTRPQGSAYDVGCWELVVAAFSAYWAQRFNAVVGVGVY